MTRHPSRILPLLGVAATALTLAACGGSSPTASGKSDEEKQLAFADCLRDEGLEVSSGSGGGTSIRVTQRRSAGEPSGPSRGDRAFETCRKRTGWAPRPPSEAEQAEFRDRALRLARCMRSHGVDMADPSSDGRMLVRINPDSPTTASAMRACGEPGSMASPDKPAP